VFGWESRGAESSHIGNIPTSFHIGNIPARCGANSSLGNERKGSPRWDERTCSEEEEKVHHVWPSEWASFGELYPY
jgi:hypothetical protein